MLKRINFLTLFGDEPKQETDSEKLARIEKALQDKDNEIAQLKKEKDEMQKNLNSIKLDALTKKVEPAKEDKEDEDIEFDFDI